MSSAALDMLFEAPGAPGAIIPVASWPQVIPPKTAKNPLSIEPGTANAGPGQKFRRLQTSVACARCKTKPPQACRLHGVRDVAPCTVAPCILHIRRGSDRTSEGLRWLATFFPSLDPHRPVTGYWRGACGVFDRGRFALITRCRPLWSTRGTCRAKKQTESVMVNTLPSNRKKNYVTIIYSLACQRNLDWRRLDRPHPRYRCCGAIASRLTAEPYRRRH